MDFEKIKLQFDGLTESDQWCWVTQNRAMIESIDLDNDNTSIFLKGDENADFPLYPKVDCGDRKGVIFLLRALGINADSV